MRSVRLKILVIGATGSVGRLVVEEALNARHHVRVLVRDPRKAAELSGHIEVVPGDVTKIETLPRATNGIDAIIFTLGSDGMGKSGAESIDYGGVRNVLHAVRPRTARIALMTSIGVTNRTGTYNRSTEVHDWKRRSERLLRASGLPYTIVRPGWFDCNAANEHSLVFLQGDRRQAGDSSDGVIARRQLAQVLVRSLTSDEAVRKTFELVATAGPAQADLDPLFAGLRGDEQSNIDGVLDAPNMPLDSEPERVRADLKAALSSTRQI